jgi:uncharacterized protein (DUF488 family)
MNFSGNVLKNSVDCSLIHNLSTKQIKRAFNHPTVEQNTFYLKNYKEVLESARKIAIETNDVILKSFKELIQED